MLRLVEIKSAPPSSCRTEQDWEGGEKMSKGRDWDRKGESDTVSRLNKRMILWGWRVIVTLDWRSESVYGSYMFSINFLNGSSKRGILLKTTIERSII